MGRDNAVGFRVLPRICYKFFMATPPSEKESDRTADRPVRFEDLRGLMKDTFDSLGGGEAFLRREREHFYESDEEVNSVTPSTFKNKE
jgi:hypothetical protein